MKTGCFAKEQIFALSNGLLEPREEQRMRAHLETCPACRKAVLGCQKLNALLDEWRPAVPSPWFDARLRARIAAISPAKAMLWSRSWQRMGWAALVVVALLVVSSVWMFRAHPARPRTTVPEVVAKAHLNAPAAPEAAVDQDQQQAVNQELDLYKNLPVLENYDMLANFDVLSELPQAANQSSD